MAGLVPFNKKNGKNIPHSIEGFANMLDDFFSDNWPSGRSLESQTFKIDVQENEKEYVVEAHLPGIRKEEINLHLHDDRLTISVEREEKSEEEKKNYIHKESRYASMSRSIYLDGARDDDVKAKLEDGVLKVTVSKDDETKKSKQIEIE